MTVNSSGGIGLAGNVTQGASKDLILRRGNIPIGDHAWMIENPGIMHDLAMRTAVPTNAEGIGWATIFLCNRASLVAGAVSRKVAYGDQGLGSVKGGYLFPVGMLSKKAKSLSSIDSKLFADVPPEAVTATTSSYSGDVARAICRYYDGFDDQW